MAKSDKQNNTNFEKLRSLAQYATMVSAVITAILWVLSEIGIGGSDVAVL